ncbi:penicillin acylase family protein [Lapillicoccus jejuensis]|uniref:Penicillin amidase n=1 Tax=Lapillicoccus jejuensis TaxID=402171 RepID=A0A542DXP2_9MICO|nr:penicillin acylase family protein [Lapillicoccus jejuensis]TQJ07858.1 penicillin amidase [Lapillicoccus jejuensis]
MARLLRDAYGVPHLVAASLPDLLRAQGWVTAHDRTWQLEHLRRRASGTLAELLGPGRGGSVLAADVLARRAGVVEQARRAYDALREDTRAALASYVEGVNAGLRSDAAELVALGATPGRWEPWTPLETFLVQHLLFARLPGKLWSARLREVLGDDARLLSSEGPSPSGSNAWAVGGERTASGLPLVAGDPHRDHASPGPYLQVRLRNEDPADPFDVVGFSFAGVPGVQHFAHAGEVAWAITNGQADYQDAFREELRRTADGGVEARGPRGWEPATAHRETVSVAAGEPVQVEVVRTARGPVFHGEVGGSGGALSLRAASDVVGELGFDALLPLLRARSVADVEAALGHWVEPVNNLVVADRAGAVRYALVGRVPLRDDRNRRGPVPAWEAGHEWTGWLDGARYDVAPDGVVVTANERRGAESDLVGTAFASPHRAGRLRELMDGRTGLDVEDMAALHADVRVGVHGSVVAFLSSLDDAGLSDAGRELRAAVLSWDGEASVGSTGVTAFARWRAAFARRVADEPVFAALREPVDLPAPLAAVHDLPHQVALGLGSLLSDAAGPAPFGLDLPALATAALEDAAAEGPLRPWGEVHTLSPAHAFDAVDGLEAPGVPRPGLRGDVETVCCEGSWTPYSEVAYRGSVARYAWDLADVARSGWVVPLGADGDPAGAHHGDQATPYADVRLLPVVTDLAALREEPLG